MKALCKVQSSKQTSKQVGFFKKINDLKESELGRQSNYSENQEMRIYYLLGAIFVLSGVELDSRVGYQLESNCVK